MWLAVYLSFYVPRRHNLVEAYLTQGETVIGDVYVNRAKRSAVALTFYGHVVYSEGSKLVRRKVQVYERYTRELAAILCLPGFPFSGQPKVDLEIDREVIELNSYRMGILFWFSWAWAIFCVLAPMYIIAVLKILDSENGNVATDWQPDVNQEKFIMVFYVGAFAIIPVAALFLNLVAWILHKRWMTLQHVILEHGEPPNEPERGCCFDDEECESIEANEYIPPESTITEGIKKVGIA